MGRTPNRHHWHWTLNTAHWALASALLSSTALADVSYSYRCQDGSRERRIDVSYTKANKAVPCEVNYHTDWGELSLWRAQVQLGYCEAKALSLVRRQRERGWTCQRRPQG